MLLFALSAIRHIAFCAGYDDPVVGSAPEPAGRLFRRPNKQGTDTILCYF
jgi:hypothetical protein